MIRSVYRRWVRPLREVVSQTWEGFWIGFRAGRDYQRYVERKKRHGS